MVKKKKVDQCFSKDVHKSLVFPQPKNIQFTVTEKERNQEIITL